MAWLFFPSPARATKNKKRLTFPPLLFEKPLNKRYIIPLYEIRHYSVTCVGILECNISWHCVVEWRNSGNFIYRIPMFLFIDVSGTLACGMPCNVDFFYVIRTFSAPEPSVSWLRKIGRLCEVLGKLNQNLTALASQRMLYTQQQKWQRLIKAIDFSKPGKGCDVWSKFVQKVLKL